jgi:hypothetical protein
VITLFGAVEIRQQVPWKSAFSASSILHRTATSELSQNAVLRALQENNNYFRIADQQKTGDEHDVGQ